MQLLPVPTVRLADQASRCRRLAEGLPDETVRLKLLTLAAEYETRVRVIRQVKPSLNASGPAAFAPHGHDRLFAPGLQRLP
jgi:hypothetical protein